MRTPRVSVPRSCGSSEELELPSEEARHLVKVLRRVVGDPVILVPDSGEPQGAEIVRIGSRGTATTVVVRTHGAAVVSDPPCRTVPWTVGVGVPKGDALEHGLRAAAELGLEAVAPLVTDRTIPRLDACVRKLERWRKIARESAKQSGRPRPLSVLQPTTFQDFVASCSSDPEVRARRWILDPTAAETLTSLWKGLSASDTPPGTEVPPRATFLIGPEGGFTPEEVARAAAGGFRRLHLSLPTLRTPTALTFVGALGALLGELAAVHPGGQASPDAEGHDPNEFSR